MIRSMLFLPGNTPNMLINGDALGADAVILDLEDAVSPQEKDAARILVRNALSRMGFGCRTVVRINALDSGLCQADLEEIVPQGPTALMLPKTANAGQIQQLDAEITRLEQQNGMKPGRVGVIALLETALGVENAFSIATASPRVLGLFLGGEDLTADLQVHSLREFICIFHIRSQILYSFCTYIVCKNNAVWITNCQAGSLVFFSMEYEILLNYFTNFTGNRDIAGDKRWFSHVYFKFRCPAVQAFHMNRA